MWSLQFVIVIVITFVVVVYSLLLPLFSEFQPWATHKKGVVAITGQYARGGIFNTLNIPPLQQTSPQHYRHHYHGLRHEICHKHHKQRLCKIFTTRVRFHFVNVLLVQFQ